MRDEARVVSQSVEDYDDDTAVEMAARANTLVAIGLLLLVLHCYDYCLAVRLRHHDCSDCSCSSCSPPGADTAFDTELHVPGGDAGRLISITDMSSEVCVSLGSQPGRGCGGQWH